MPKNKYIFDRRSFLRLSALSAVGASLFPLDGSAINVLAPPMKRKFGKIDFDVTTLGLGGQASLQWTPAEEDPVEIIRKAFELGVNYFDTSNLYGPSQENYGKAFRKLDLIPGEKIYNRRLRENFFLTSKTHLRWAKGNYPTIEKVNNWTDGTHGEGAVADLKRSLSIMFGDGKGNYPEGAYLDMFLAHSVTTMEEVDVLFKGLETPLVTEENFGALVALRDFRDGTNLTGLNPNREKLIRHIGFSGHASPPVMIEMLQRDEFDVLDGILVAVNVNDKKMFNMQYNVLPIAQAKNMGVIGMKVFADGAMYGKEPRWSRTSADVVRKVGARELPSQTLIEYSLTTPGVHTVIIGIGHIDRNPDKCQLVQNFNAAQVAPDGMSKEERLKAEALGASILNGKTNYFQQESIGLTAPKDVEVKRIGNTATLSWRMAYAGEFPIARYEIVKNGETIYSLSYKPVVTKAKMNYIDCSASSNDEYQVVTVDESGKRMASESFKV